MLYLADDNSRSFEKENEKFRTKHITLKKLL